MTIFFGTCLRERHAYNAWIIVFEYTQRQTSEQTSYRVRLSSKYLFCTFGSNWASEIFMFHNRPWVEIGRDSTERELEWSLSSICNIRGRQLSLILGSDFVRIGLHLDLTRFLGRYGDVVQSLSSALFARPKPLYVDTKWLTLSTLIGDNFELWFQSPSN